MTTKTPASLIRNYRIRRHGDVTEKLTLFRFNYTDISETLRYVYIRDELSYTGGCCYKLLLFYYLGVGEGHDDKRNNELHDGCDSAVDLSVRIRRPVSI